MSIRFVSRHVVANGETVGSLVRDYRLSSWRAIRDIPANAALRSRLPDTGALPIGLVLAIPPNAAYLTKERLYALHGLRSAVSTHFDLQLAAAETTLRPALLAASAPASSAAVESALAGLAADLVTAIDDLARTARPLVGVSVGMSHTHVAEQPDLLAAGTVDDPRCGLYWTVTPGKLQSWQELWQAQPWQSRWRDQDPERAFGAVTQHLTLVRSIVVQQVDARIREALSLEQRLRAESC